MEKRWVELQGDVAVVDRLMEDVQISRPVAELLYHRGIRNYEEARHFFRPELKHLHDPFLMKDMDLAIERIEKALAQQEKILIYGDYDVDGTTAVSLLYSFLKKYHTAVSYYIPDRYKEGYGISFAGIDYAAEHGYSLMIALDCGIKSIDKVQYAQTKHIDFIICDHHLPGEELPQAVAVLDPKRKDCSYPYKELPGCAIGFKLVQAFCLQREIPFDTILPLLDLVAVSIGSDIVPITGENRILAFYGLECLNKNPRPGFRALLELAGDKKHHTMNDVVFLLGPRINAAGRIQHASEVVQLLISEEEVHINETSLSINQKNQDRKDIDQQITQEALQMMEADEQVKERRSTVLFNPSWHKGVIGIVASRIIEKYYKPTIIFTESNGMAVGSARSVQGFDLYEAISSCSELLEQYGGHTFAAGLTIKLENLDLFKNRFEEVVKEVIREESFTEPLYIDAVIDLDEINPKLYRILKQFEPFGPGNLNPVFCVKSVYCPYSPQVVGNNHLKFTIKQDGDQTFDCIAWNMGHLKTRLENKNKFALCFSIEENEWNGKVKLQLKVKDIALL